MFLLSCNRFIAIERNEFMRSDTAFMKYVKEENMPLSSGNSVVMLNGAQLPLPKSRYQQLSDRFHDIIFGGEEV